MRWFKRFVCERFGCVRPKTIPYKVTREDEQAACVEWTCPRCGEVATALQLKARFTRELAKHAHKMRQQQENVPLDGHVTEVTTPRLK